MGIVKLSLVDRVSGHAKAVCAPSDLTVGNLLALANTKNTALTIAGCSPSAAATLGDMHDACADANGVLEVIVEQEGAFGGVCCCGPSPQEVAQDKINEAIKDALNNGKFDFGDYLNNAK